MVSLGGSDQAEGLRRLLSHYPARVLAVVGSELGAGQSTVSWQLAVALQSLGQTVLWVDAHPNPDRGHPPRQRFSTGGIAGIWECVLGRARSEALAPPLRAWIQSRRTDWVIFDAPPVEAKKLDVLWQLVEHVLFVSRANSVAMKPLLTIARTLHHALAFSEFKLVINRIDVSDQNDQALSEALSVSMKTYLQLELGYLGGLIYDERLEQAQNNHQAIVEIFPRLEVSVALRTLAHACLDWIPLGGSTQHHSSLNLSGSVAMATEWS